MKPLLAVAFVALAWILPIPAGALSLPVTGSLQYQLRHGGGGGGDSSNTSHTSTLELGSVVPIWRHWLGRVEGRGLFSQTFSNGPEGRGSDQVVTGRGDLTLFPQSSFPFSAFFQRSDSRIDGANNLDSDRQVTRFGVRQRFESDRWGRYQFGYDRRRVDQELDFANAETTEESVQDQISFSAAKRFEFNELNYSFNYLDTDQQVSDASFSEQSHVLSHVLNPATTYNVNSLASYSRVETTGSVGVDTTRQLSSNVFWRPRMERPLRISGNALVRDRSVEGAGAADTRVASVRGSGNYQWTDDIDLSFGASATDDQLGGSRRNSFSESVGFGYAPEGYRFGGFAYSWNTGASAAATQSTTAPDSEQLTGNLGHSLRREWMVGGAPLTGRLSQRGSGTVDTGDENSQTLAHSANLSWTLSRGRSQYFSSFDVSDNRIFDEDETVFQLANFQLSGNLRLSRYRSLSGSTTVQAARNRSTASDEVVKSFSSSIGLTYRDARFLSVRNLDYISQLRWRSNDLLLLVESERQEEVSDKLWRNRWTYGIGLLDLSLDTRISADRDNDPSYSLVFRLRRSFTLF